MSEITLKAIQKASSRLSFDDLEKRAQPWKTLTEEYLSFGEFVTMLRINNGSRKAREICYYFRLNCSRGDQSLIPGYIRNMFVDDNVSVLLLEHHGAAKFEYRIPIKSLKTEYKSVAEKLIAGRRRSEIARPSTLRALKLLSEDKDISIPDLLDLLVAQALRTNNDSSNIKTSSSKPLDPVKGNT